MPQLIRGVLALSEALTSLNRQCLLMHMRTALNIDDSLLKRVEQLTGISEKTALIRRGLETLLIAC